MRSFRRDIVSLYPASYLPVPHHPVIVEIHPLLSSASLSNKAIHRQRHEQRFPFMRNQISSPGNIRNMNSIYTDFTLTLVRETKSELRCSTYQIEFTFYQILCFNRNVIYRTHWYRILIIGNENEIVNNACESSVTSRQCLQLFVKISRCVLFISYQIDFLCFIPCHFENPVTLRLGNLTEINIQLLCSTVPFS